MHTTSAPTAHSFLARHRRLVTVTIVAALTVVAGCSDEQRRDLGEEDARDALVAQVEQVVADQGLELDGDLDCTANIDETSAVTSSCTGTATSGAVVGGTFTGTADVDAETCTAQLVVEIDSEQVADDPDVDCFDGG